MASKDLEILKLYIAENCSPEVREFFIEPIRIRLNFKNQQ